MGQSYKLIGAPCAHRGPYTFYKAFKYTKNDITNILTINEFFFVKLWNDSDLISIGELRLLWEDKNCNLALASLRLYILPENTPDGRINDIHGEDEVLAITEKVVIRIDDLLTWITEAADWSWGLDSVWRKELAIDNKISSSNGDPNVNGDDQKIESLNGNRESISDKSKALVDFSAIDYTDIDKEKSELDKLNWDIRTGVIVLSYARYCRYRGLRKRLEGVHDEWLRNNLIGALGGLSTSCRMTKILFCKDTFDYPELEGHELLCNHLAPKLRSRLPKKKRELYPSPGASDSDNSSNSCSTDENEDERLSSSASSSISSNSRISFAASRSAIQKKPYPPNLLPLPLDDSIQITAVDEQKKQKAFTQNLYAFMRARLTPIGRLPYIGNREINLFEFYNKVKMLGGHSGVTNNKLWKYIFEALGGDNSSAATATIIKKHYEKYLLPYEQHLAQQFKQTSFNQLLARQQPAEIYKSQTAGAAEYERRRQLTLASRPVQSLVNRLLPNSKPGDKENIPLARKRMMAGVESAALIELCGSEAANSSRHASSHQHTATSSSVVSDIIDLCNDPPIKRSVPSIAATLFPKKRKLDILREGGLEVTPISSVFGGSVEPDVVTITKTISVDTDNEARNSAYEEPSVEILDPKKYTTSNREGTDGTNHQYSKLPSQVLDLSTMKSNGRVAEDSLIKKISPNLGPNIEISIVPNDETQRDSKKRKALQLPIPALRKISTGEISVKNLSMKVNEMSKHKPRVTIAAAPSRRMDSNSSIKDLRPSVSITATEKSVPFPVAANLGLPANLNQSLYIAALYNSVLPSAASNEFLQQLPSLNENLLNAAAYQHPLSFLTGSLLQQQQQQQQNLNNGSSSERYSKMLNNDQILPD